MGKNKNSHTKSASNASQSIVVVVGMHRSGSSVLTRGLKTLNINLGNNLMKANAGENDRGFWEDLDLYGVNRQLLTSLGTDWDRLTPIDPEDLKGPHTSSLRQTATKLLSEKMVGNHIFAFKDPRTSILLPFWQCVFNDLNIEAKYVISVRNPLEAAESLQIRNKFEKPKSLMLWLKYMVRIAKTTEDYPRVFVHFHDVLQNPEGQFQRIANTLNITVPENFTSLLDEFQTEFLSTDLRHHQIADAELSRCGLAPDAIVKFYEELLRLCRLSPSEKPEIHRKTLRTAERTYQTNPQLLTFVDHLDAHAQKGRAEHDEAQSELARLTAHNAQLSLQIQTTREQEKRTRDQLEQTNLELRELKKTNAAEIGILIEEKQNLLDEKSRKDTQHNDLFKKTHEESTRLHAEVRKLIEEKADLNRQYSLLQQSNETNRTTMQERMNRLSDENNQAIQQARQYSSIIDDIQELNKSLIIEKDKLEHQLAQSHKKLAQQKNANQNTLKQELQKQESMTSKISQLESERDRHNKSIADLEGKILRKTHALAEQEKSQAHHKNMLSKSHSVNDALKSELEKRTHDLDQLNKRYEADFIEAERTINSMQNTLSWKLTKPLRVLSALIKRQ